MTQNSQYELLQKLDRRTQKPNESVMTFVTEMRAIFRALPMPEPEIRLVYTLRRKLRKEISRVFVHEDELSHELTEEEIYELVRKVLKPRLKKKNMKHHRLKRIVLDL